MLKILRDVKSKLFGFDLIHEMVNGCMKIKGRIGNNTFHCWNVKITIEIYKDTVNKKI
tara:strand:- start:368 stop:541 length:174 start_codon:yes stop_codon:yes gene_type:complete